MNSIEALKLFDETFETTIIKETGIQIIDFNNELCWSEIGYNLTAIRKVLKKLGEKNEKTIITTITRAVAIRFTCPHCGHQHRYGSNTENHPIEGTPYHCASCYEIIEFEED